METLAVFVGVVPLVLAVVTLPVKLGWIRVCVAASDPEVSWCDFIARQGGL